MRGVSSLLCVGLVYERFSLCIETIEGEVCQGVHEGDIIVVSAPESLEFAPAVLLLLLTGRFHFPLIVLPKGHPGSGRVRYVVSVGSIVKLSDNIERGTHPEQNIICSSNEFSGVSLYYKDEFIVAEDLSSSVNAEMFLIPNFNHDFSSPGSRIK